MMQLPLKIFLKILRYEIGIRGLVLLLIASGIIGVGKDPENYFATSLLPGIFLIGFLFEFRRGNKNFFNQFLYLPNSIYWVKIFSITWALLYFIYNFLFYILAHKELSSNILIASYHIFIICYLVSSYLLLRYSYILVMAVACVLIISFGDWRIALAINTLILLFSFYPFRVQNIKLFNTISDPLKTDVSSNRMQEYSINKSNYVIKFLYI
ncbi:MAG: hypothetical protein P8Y99_19060, partial [Calditrichaceae bacterium]